MAGYSGPDRIYGSTFHQIQNRGSNFWGPRESIYQILDVRKFTFLQKAFSWWTRDSNSRPAAEVLPTTPYVKVTVRWATGKDLTSRPPKPSLITVRPKKHTKKTYHISYRCPFGKSERTAVRAATSTASDLSGSGRADMLTRPAAAARAAVATGAPG